MRKYRYQSIRTGLVGHWRPSRGPTGNTLIDSVRGNHGTLTNGPTWTPSVGGGDGYALRFDGSDDYANTSLVLSSATASVDSISISVWVRLNVLNSYQCILGNYTDNSTGVEIFVNNANSAIGAGNFVGGGFGWIVGGTVDTSRWWHVVYTRLGNSNSIWLNAGQNFTQVSTIANSTTALGLGSRSRSSAVFPFNGFLDSVAVFNRPLSANEVLTLYQAGRGALDQRVKKIIVRGVTLAPSSFKAAWTLGSNLVLGI